MTSFNDFVHKYKLKNKATSNIIIQQVHGSVELDNIGIDLGDGSFSSIVGIVNLHQSKGTHRVLYTNEIYFDSYGCGPPQKLSKFIIRRNGYCLFSEYKIQDLRNKRDSYSVSYCLYVF